MKMRLGMVLRTQPLLQLVALVLALGAVGRPAAAQDQVTWQIENYGPTLVADAAHLVATPQLPLTSSITMNFTVRDEEPFGLLTEVRARRSVVVNGPTTDYEIGVTMRNPGDTADALGMDGDWWVAELSGSPLGTPHVLVLDLTAGPFSVLDPAGDYTGGLEVTITAINMVP